MQSLGSYLTVRLKNSMKKTSLIDNEINSETLSVNLIISTFPSNRFTRQKAQN